MLCGKERCPIIIKHEAHQRTQHLMDSTEIEGSSPPGVFVGRFGYPKVSVGPLVPPIHGDTEIYDLPEAWANKTIDEIAEFRFSLVRGKHAVNVHDVESPDPIIQLTREFALAKNVVESNVEFTSKPRVSIPLGDEVQPFGPSARLKELEASSNIHFEKNINRAYSDTDLKAAPAIVELHERDVPVSRIQKAFSVGAFGLEKNRTFVPTRWSITAVDSSLGENLMKETRQADLLDRFLVFEHDKIDNRWIIIMMPRPWSYELIEAWYPGTIWNPEGKEIEMLGDSESFRGRTKYADIGGCYYAARLAANEYLTQTGKQAAVSILREAHPGYIMPVGVWLVRESVREALRKQPSEFGSLNECLLRVSGKFEIPLQKWLRHSSVIREALYQRRLTEYA
ncbi:hypothetical protein HYS54_03710 [Candidatus Micrarchaeota archaeon]|nr:hypothetical protein [Candidatus Micrarchaeota archaeon]